jgi:hypothetical protein
MPSLVDTEIAFQSKQKECLLWLLQLPIASKVMKDDDWDQFRMEDVRCYSKVLTTTTLSDP